MNISHVTNINCNEINFGVDSVIDGVRVGDMDCKTLLNIIKQIGGDWADVNVKDNLGNMVAYYDHAKRNAYYYGAIPAGTVFSLPK